MQSTPRIGITRWDDVPDEARDRYWNSARAAGGTVIDLNEAVAGREPDAVAGIDGLMLTGGIDVDPAVYGAERHPKVKEIAPGRDAMELACLRAALDRDIPVLAICRGHQVLNVGFGGTLLQHIDSGEHRADFRTEGHPSRWHTLRVAPDTRLASTLATTTAEINSRHHQAVTQESLGIGLRPVAWSPEHGTELIEGMESEQHRWVVGVQWHPERPEPEHAAFAPLMRKLFAAFVAETKKVRA